MTTKPKPSESPTVPLGKKPPRVRDDLVTLSLTDEERAKLRRVSELTGLAQSRIVGRCIMAISEDGGTHG